MNSLPTKRLVILSIFLFFLFSLLIARFYKIQIEEGDHWESEAKKQHFFFIKEPFVRGTFYSNASIKQGNPEKPQQLVFDIEKFHLYIDPKSIPTKHKKTISKYLVSKLDLKAEEQLNFDKQFYKRSRSRKLAMWLDPEFKDSISEWWNSYAKKYKIPRNALFFVADFQRSYPYGKLLGQVLHTVQAGKNEKTGQAIPTGGLELYFDKYLQGKPGKRRLMRSPKNAFETGEVISLPEHGADVYLTINHCLQSIAEEEIEKGVKKCKAKCGWALMLNPYTGEILALAQYPYFFPPDYQDFFNNKEFIEHTRIKAITDANEPGSIMKPVTMVVALKANEELRKKGQKPLFNPDDRMDTSVGRFPGRPKLLSDTHFHHYLNLEMALQKSSNIYVARLAQMVVERMGKDWYRSVLQDCFGLGLKTHIELPAESSGLVPRPGRKHPNGALEWSAATPYSLAMGHNIQVTSLQMARLYAIFANGGFLVDPTIVRKIVKSHLDQPDEILVDNTTPERLAHFPRVLDDETLRLINRALKYITKLGGTASRANVWGYTEAGKTATANKISNGHYVDQYCSTFVGFTPAKNPAFVLVVTMDEPEFGYIPGVGKNHHGGLCAAPVFREIASRSLEYLGIPFDDPHGYPKGDPRHDADKADWLPETRKLQEMYESWNNGKTKKDAHL